MVTLHTSDENLVEALRESEARLKTIFDTEPECVKVVSLDGKLIDMNPAGLAMIEIEDRNSAIGGEILGMVHPEDRSVFLSLHRKAAGGGSGIAEFRIIGIRGTQRHVESHCVPLRNASGEIASVLSITRDITERKRIEASRRESEERIRAAMEASLDAFYIEESVRDRRGRIIDFRFVDMNCKGAELVKRRREDLIGKRLCEVFPLARTRGFLKKFIAVVETGKPLVEEFAVNSNNVTAAWLHQQVVRLGDGIAITSRDITDRRIFEDALRRLPRQIMDAQQEERRRVSQELHDNVGQLLASVRFRLKGVRQKLRIADSKLLRQWNLALGGLEEAAGIVRGTAHRLHPTDPSQIGFRAALRAAGVDFEERTGIRVRVLIPARIDRRLRAEIQVQLYRIVQEALTNIEKHSRAGKVCIRLTINIRKPSVQVEIIDDGEGIALNSLNVRKRIAAGLGLASMQERVRILNGHFHLDTQRSKGLRILVQIPIGSKLKS